MITTPSGKNNLPTISEHLLCARHYDTCLTILLIILTTIHYLVKKVNNRIEMRKLESDSKSLLIFPNQALASNPLLPHLYHPFLPVPVGNTSLYFHFGFIY